MTEIAYSQGNAHLQKRVISLKKEINNEELTRKNQEREIKIMHEMEKDIRKKLSLLEKSIEKMDSQKKKKTPSISHQRSISNPEDATKAGIREKKALSVEEDFSKSSDDSTHIPLQRASQSYDYRRVKRGANPVTPESRRRQVETPFLQTHEIGRNRTHGSAQNLVSHSKGYGYEVERPKTSANIHNSHCSPSPLHSKGSALGIVTRPSPITKAVSSGITSYRSRNVGNAYEIQRDNKDMRYQPRYPKLSSGDPREAVYARDMNTFQSSIRSSSAFGMYKTNPTSSNFNSLPRISAPERGREREKKVEMRRKVPVSNQQDSKFNYERSHSMENLLEKRPLAKTNSTILHCSDFKIISLESRTIAQQIKLKELEKNYVNKNRILTKTEWVSFVSEFSETQKEVRNLDIEWQELFSELMSRNTEYNDHMNKIRMWVTALKADSKFLQDIMSDNLATAL